MYSCVQGGTYGTATNIESDPSFADFDGPDNNPFTVYDNNYRLTHLSPCIDTGQNDTYKALPQFAQFDRDGNLRIARGQHSLTADMGAFEYNSKPFALTQIEPLDESSLALTWNSQPNNSYILWFAYLLDDVPTIGWIEWDTVPSQESNTSLVVPRLSGASAFWRVEMVPEHAP